jgi:serine/threonine protein kinase
METDGILDDDTPIFTLCEVKILETLKEDAVSVFKVSINESVMCAKAAVEPSQRRSILREIRCLQRMHNRGSSVPAHVPQLRGLLIHKDQILGFVMCYIEPSSMGRTLTDYDLDVCAMDEKRKWYYQIERTLRQAHEADVTVGDVKAENILMAGLA